MKCFRARLKPICATLRGLGHLRTAILCDSSQMPQSKVKQKWGEDFLRACTIERHLDKSQKKIRGNFDENAGSQVEQPEQAPALLPTKRTFECGHTVEGKT